MKGNCLEFENDAEAIRFHVVVFNFERIDSFLDNFHKIQNFRPDRDRVVVLDCSLNHASQKQRVAEFASERNWTLGKELKVIQRKNWGIDQGARIDYFAALQKASNRPKFIWQFQEHYLDLDSPWSFWPSDTPKIGGCLKEDTIPDGVVIDLDQCESVYTQNPDVGVIYADRAKLGIFRHPDGREWFYADGANFSVRTSDVFEAFHLDTLSTYKSIYDGSYEWTLFLEMDICRRLTRPGRRWHDLVSGERFEDAQDLRRREVEKQISLHQEAEWFYGGLYQKYEERFERFSHKSEFRRRFQTLGSFSYLGLRGSKIGRGVRSALGKLGE